MEEIARDKLPENLAAPSVCHLYIARITLIDIRSAPASWVIPPLSGDLGLFLSRPAVFNMIPKKATPPAAKPASTRQGILR